MKIVVLKTYTADTDIYWRTLSTIMKYDVHPIQYDHLPHNRHWEVVNVVRTIRPNVIIFIGAVESSHGRPILRLPVLCELSKIAPLIHMCGDAGDEPWWPTLHDYDSVGCFSAQVSIDGNMDSPIAKFKNGIVKLVPVDPLRFVPNTPWESRTTHIGITGGIGHGERGGVMTAAQQAGAQWPGYGVPYDDVVKFMLNCKVIVNCPMTGSGQADHVKARVTETGWAGACLFERRNNQTARWFKPGHDYLEYVDAYDLVDKLDWAKNNDSSVSKMASSLHGRVNTHHHPMIFWRDVFARANLEI